MPLVKHTGRWPDRQIAERLCLSQRTVSHHVSAICAQIGARRRTGAVVAGLKHGLIGSKAQHTGE